MELVIIVAAVGTLIVATCFGILLRNLAAGPQNLPATADWIDQLSVEKYAPMRRLLCEDDVRFLASQPGSSRSAIRQFRAQRCEMFLGYLRWLKADFGLICAALRLLMVQSQTDRPDLAVLLIRQKMLFATSLIAIYCNLALYRVGIASVQVDDIIGAFDVLRIELRQLIPVNADFAA
jgi:hypothetical protein